MIEYVLVIGTSIFMGEDSKVLLSKPMTIEDCTERAESLASRNTNKVYSCWDLGYVKAYMKEKK